jgi:HSP20 family molecular chaperone IbpA
VLNNLSSSNLPSGKKVNTKGLSFKYVNVDEGTKLILLDTAGSYSPVKVQTNMSIIEREATEHFILELVFDISDYFLFVVNDFTSLDQRYLDKLTRSLQTSANKGFREVIVVHNFKEIEGQDILDHVWETQVKQIYSDGSVQQTLVAAKNPMTGNLEEKKVTWFKSPFTRHVCLVNQDSILGMNHNPWSFSLLRYWLKAVLVPLNREFSVVENVINFSDSKLSVYFKEQIDLTLQDTEDPLNKKILNKIKLDDKLRMPHISIDGSGFVVTRPDAFTPNVDIHRGETEYTIVVDVPGMKKSDITIYRQNVVTMVEGKRKRSDFDPAPPDRNYERSERKFGDFALNFKIPDEYERKWCYFECEDGVLCIKYKRDVYDNDSKS